jgi:cyclic pyranopterin phosphate synthase
MSTEWPLNYANIQNLCYIFPSIAVSLNVSVLMSESEQMQEKSFVDAQSQPLTHVNDRGEAKMVDVGGKAATRRSATACSSILMSRQAADAIRNDALKKGDCIAVARIAAIQAAKQASNLIPLCHMLLIDSVDVTHEWLTPTELRWAITVTSTGPTGVEMEALTAASVAALTVYDMCKAVDRSMVISRVLLLSKVGGARGDYNRTE